MSLIRNITFLYIVIGLLASISIISLALSFKQVGFGNQNQNQKTQTSRSLPLDIESSGIKNARLIYYLTGTLVETTPLKDGTLWKVQTGDNKEYSFYVTPDADIFTKDPVKDPAASPSASITPLTVKKGTKINAFVGYDLKNNKANSGRIILEQ